MENFTAVRPLHVKCIQPKGASIQMSVGARLKKRPDGLYEATRMHAEHLSPPTVRATTFVFDINPFMLDDIAPAPEAKP